MQNAGRLVRSASLSGYIELTESLGHDAGALLRKVGLSARLLRDPEALIPSQALRELLERKRRLRKKIPREGCSGEIAVVEDENAACVFWSTLL
ncbi:hypothetical protein [Cupriavidus necator]|uniref:hypothetical protein n=1 Tax=Cupriavidus necator TaxID=106590 RepID=UPI0038B28C57